MTTSDEDDVDYEETEGFVVRPFMLTRGRTRTSSIPIAMETMVDRKEIDEERFLRFEPATRSIWELLDERRSAAEISALLGLPLGVVIVLVGDLAENDAIVVHETVSTVDTDLVRRLIDGVRAL